MYVNHININLICCILLFFFLCLVLMTNLSKPSSNRTWEALSTFTDTVDSYTIDDVCVTVDNINGIAYIVGNIFKEVYAIISYDIETDTFGTYNQFEFLDEEEIHLKPTCIYIPNNNTLYIFGGIVRNEMDISITTNDILSYDFDTNSWSYLESSLLIPHYRGKAFLIDDYVLIVGGSSTNNDNQTITH